MTKRASVIDREAELVIGQLHVRTSSVKVPILQPRRQKDFAKTPPPTEPDAIVRGQINQPPAEVDAIVKGPATPSPRG